MENSTQDASMGRSELTSVKMEGRAQRGAVSSKMLLGVRIVAVALGVLLIVEGSHDLLSTQRQAAQPVGQASQPIEVPSDALASLGYQPATSPAPAAGSESLLHRVGPGQTALVGPADPASGTCLIAAGVYTDSGETADLTATVFRRR